MDGNDFWDRVERSYEAVGPSAAVVAGKEAKADSSDSDSKQWRRRRIVLDAASILFWSYTVVKLFVTDIDRVAAERLAPWSVRLLGYRFILWVLFAVFIVGFAKKRYWMYLLYIAGFPLIVLLWKIPKLIYRSRSWSLLLTIMNLVSTFMLGFRYFVVTKG